MKTVRLVQGRLLGVPVPASRSPPVAEPRAMPALKIVTSSAWAWSTCEPAARAHAVWKRVGDGPRPRPHAVAAPSVTRGLVLSVRSSIPVARAAIAVIAMSRRCWSITMPVRTSPTMAAMPTASRSVLTVSGSPWAER